MRSGQKARTPEDDAILRQEALKGRSAAEIAGKIGRSLPFVRGPMFYGLYCGGEGPADKPSCPSEPRLTAPVPRAVRKRAEYQPQSRLTPFAFHRDYWGIK